MSEEEIKSESRQEKATAGKKRKLLGIEPVETRHELPLVKRTLKYTARAGAIPLKDEFDETEAEVFFMAYELEGTRDRAARPLTFVFNGGPGSSSIWLHMGAVGPYRVRMEKEGWCSRAGKSGCNFLGDNPGFAYANDNYLAGALIKEFYCFYKTFINFIE